MPSDDAKWHQDKKKAIMTEMPDVTQWEGPYRPSIIYVAALVLVQWSLWYCVHHYVHNILLLGVLAYLNANTVLYSLSTFIHENSHGLILGRVFGKDSRQFCAAMIELGFVSFGEQWEYTIVHNYLHHPHLNDQKEDSECPDVGHVAMPPDSKLLRWVYPIAELLPLGVMLTQGGLSNNTKPHLKNKMAGPMFKLQCVTVAVVGTLIYLGAYYSLLFAVWSTSLYSSRWCIALHGQSIAEHFRVGQEPDGKTPATHSTYHTFENVLGFNTGYHDEHHTFPNVAWARLPDLKRKFPEHFDNVNPYHYTKLWWAWASRGFDTEYFRMCRNH